MFRLFSWQLLKQQFSHVKYLLGSTQYQHQHQHNHYLMDPKIFILFGFLVSVCFTLEIKSVPTPGRSTLLCPDKRPEEPNLMEKLINFIFGKKATSDTKCKSIQRNPQENEKIKKEATSFQVNYNMYWKNKKI